MSRAFIQNEVTSTGRVSLFCDEVHKETDNHKVVNILTSKERVGILQVEKATHRCWI
jgi:hypothetical protein